LSAVLTLEPKFSASHGDYSPLFQLCMCLDEQIADSDDIGGLALQGGMQFLCNDFERG
jgi:hypothetical protein